MASVANSFRAAGFAVALIAGGASVAFGAAPDPVYVGLAACAACHQQALEQFKGSHHDRAMQPADASTVLGNFNKATFTYNGVTSTFFKKDGQFFVRTDGPDGALHEYRIAYTFGVDPLQQYLIEFPGGRLQALSVCWDTRSAAAGGQRWFDLYPGEHVDFRDVLHWTGPAHNWNYMCSDCHATNVKKNYRAQDSRFETTWSELGVSCEACHGPGSRHVDWAHRKRAGDAVADPTHGLVVDLTSRGGSWSFEGRAPIAHLTAARDSRVQVVCARCHARRAQIGDDYRQDRPLGDTYILSLLEEGLYQADGQILDEVFEYESFLQSPMHERGVVCTDCHDAHSGRLLASGNAVCAKCHLPSHYDTPAHHHHKAGSEAARCIECHMPARNYMVVHRRHDHSFRVPRPDLSATLGTPNTCTDCHHERTARWAADAIVKWYGAVRVHGPAYAAAFAAGRTHAAHADDMLGTIIRDRSFPDIVRATALTLLQEPDNQSVAELIAGSLPDSDPLVRRAAASRVTTWEPSRRWAAAGPLLSDPIRSVRLEAVTAVADNAVLAGLTPEQRQIFERALTEYRAAQAFNADRADAWLNLGVVDLRLGNAAVAEQDYERAIRLQPSFMPAYVNLADLYREQGRDVDGERVLRGALSIYGRSADAHYALGLLLVRRKEADQALLELAAAVQLSPENPRYAYVYALALDSVGQRDKAIAELEKARQRFSGDRDILRALLEVARRSGDRVAVMRWTRELHDLDPGEASPTARPPSAGGS